MKLIIHPDKCTGCRICEIVCSIIKENVINPRMARIHIVTAYPGIIDFPLVCKQCEEPACVSACPIAAISINRKTKAIKVDITKCKGCGLCAEVCAYGAVAIICRDVQKLAAICDLCEGEPECAKWCPFAVIELKT